MLAKVRRTKSSACPSCGAHGEISHDFFCQPEVESQFLFDDSRADGYFGAAADDLASMDDEDQWMRLWYAPRIRPGKHVW
jgi:hypothetical protein